MNHHRIAVLQVRGGRRSHVYVLLALFCILAVIYPTLLSAQEFRGTISGQVADSKGAVVPSANVEAVGPQQTYKTTTSSKGDFTIPLVQPGTYQLSVEAPGFKKIFQSGVVVNISDKLNLTFVLEVGSVTQTVSVSADQAQLNTADASGGTVIDPKQIQNLPMNGRQMYSLLSLTPGVKTPTLGNSARAWDESNAYSINGQWGNYNQFSLNGAPVSQQNGGASGTWNISPAVDAVEEFKVMTNTYDAQYGRTNGGTVNTILKSGTSEFHGTVFDFWRNSVLDANRYDLNQSGTRKPFHNQHQFGGTVGGPVLGLKKNTFFFFSFEGWREVQPNSVTTTTITSDILPGTDGSVNLTNYLQGMGKTAIYDPATTRCAVTGQNPCEQYLRDPFPGNIISANRISKIGVNLLKLLPLANQPGYRNNYVTNNPGRYHYNQPIVRIDHAFSDATRVYGMFAWWSGLEYNNTSGFPGAAARGNINHYKSSLTQVIDITHAFRPNLFADIRLSYNRAYNMSPNGAQSAGLSDVTASSIGLSMPSLPTTTHNYLPEIHTDDGVLPDYVGNVVDPSVFETYDIAPSVTHVLGKHNLHYGAEISWYHDVANGVRRPNGGFNFGPDFTQQDPKVNNNDGSSIAGFLLGYPTWGGVEYNYPTYESYQYYAAYLQDDWKVTHRLALNLGLRYENELSPTDRWRRLQAGLCLTCQNPISSGVNFGLFPGNKLPNGTSIANPIIGGMMFQKDRSPYENTWGILLPKIGASFSITNRLVMRGGWGISRALGFELGGTSTWDATTSYVTSLDDGLTPTQTFRGGTPFPNGVTVPAGDSQGLMSGVGDGIWYDGWNRKIPYTHQFSFGFQGEAPGHIIWDIEYVGARTKDLRAGMQHNHLAPGQFAQGHATPAYLNQMVQNPFYGVQGIPASSYLGSYSTLPIRDLMVPYPQYITDSGPQVWEWNTPQGYSHYDSLIAKAEKRITGGGLLSNGLSFTTAFTWSKAMTATDRLNNGLLTDPEPFYGIDSSDRSFLFSLAGVYQLPLGKGGIVAKDAHGLLGQVVNDWQLNWIVSDQSGNPVKYPNQYLYTCGGSFNVRPAHKSWGSYLNNTSPNCFSGFPEYTAVTRRPYTIAVRTPWAEQSQVAMQKQFAIREQTKLQFRVEAFNLTNTPIFNGPDTDSSPNSPIQRHSNISIDQPGAYTGYGTIGPSTQNSPRQLQLSLKILF